MYGQFGRRMAFDTSPDEKSFLQTRHRLQQCQRLAINTAFEAHNIIRRVPEIHPTKIPEFRFIGKMEIEFHIVVMQFQQKPDLFLSYTQWFAM